MKKRQNSLSGFPRLIHFILFFSIALNVFFAIGPIRNLILPDTNESSLQQLRDIKEPGTYGPSDMEVVEGSLTISTPDVKLQNTLITGDLHLTAKIGDGSVDLVNVAVEDTALIQGGGENTIVFTDAIINHLIINREVGKVRVVLLGNTQVEKVTIQGEAVLNTTGLSDEGYAKDVNIETPLEATLEGSFHSITIITKDARLTISSGQVGKLITTEEAEDAVIILVDGAIVEGMEPGCPLELSGEGQVNEVVISAPGLFKLSGNIEQISVGGRGIFLELGSGTTSILSIEESPGTVMIHLTDKGVIKSLELNSSAGITGSGSIEFVRVNVSGVTMEQIPGRIEFASGVKAEVGGQMLPEETVSQPDPPTGSSPGTSPGTSPAPSQPATPTVNLNSVSNIVVNAGQSRNVDAVVSPGDAVISASSSNTNVASVSVSGKRISVTGKAAGTATITVTASKAGYFSRTRTFTVTVDPIREFLINDSLLPGDYKLVRVRLWYANQQNYTVTVGGVTLNPPTASIPYFYGDVPTGSANRGNVVIK